MKTETKNLLYEFIKRHQGVSPKEIIQYQQQNPTGIFKHLLDMQNRGTIYKIGKPPKVRYYAYTKTMEANSETVKNAINWAVSGDARLLTPEILCQTRDVFQARTDRLINDLKQIIQNDNLVYLIVAAVGEIGNNSFDHNLGQWRDTPGVFFEFHAATRNIIMADRGQGIRQTIHRVRPDVETDAQALRIAFTEMVSGRAPEKRGNGLKFVKKVIDTNQLQLIYYSGVAVVQMRGGQMVITQTETKVPGTLACITF